MKMFAIVALAGAALVAAAPGASAFELSPTRTSFSGNGSISISDADGDAYVCNLLMRASTNKRRVGKILDWTMTPGVSQCTSTQATYLAWEVKAVNATTAKILNFALRTPFGDCGPAKISVAISSGGTWTINSPVPPPCSNVTASFVTAPTVVIAP